MTKLTLITSGFPYGHSEETFLAREAAALNDAFALTLVPRDPQPGAPCQPACSSWDVRPLLHASEVRHKVGALLRVLCDADFYREAVRILRAGRGRRAARLRAAAVFDAQALQLERKLRGMLSEGILYSYWYDYGALAAVKLKRRSPKLRAVARTHGYELYEARNAEQWQPFKPLMDANMDRLLFSCNAAKRYYLERYRVPDGPKYPVCYIGSARCARRVPRKDALVVFSCSSVIPLKRVPLLVRALSLVRGVPLEWHHIGDGEEMETVRALAQTLLGGKENVQYVLEGAVNARRLSELYALYRPELFLTTTQTEGGCPVSLTEAAAQGLALIGTDAGGVSEIVGPENGFLLPVEAAPEEVARAVERYAALSPEERAAMREASCGKWSALFDAQKNAAQVVRLLQEIAAEP